LSENKAIDVDEALKLDNQLCFPLYAASKEVVRRYTPFLNKLDLTYTQYICLMALWENTELTVGELGERLYLDSGTLTPLLKKLEAKGLVQRRRSPDDERKVIVCLTDEGRALKAQAAEIPLKMAACIDLTLEEAQQLRALLEKVLR